MPCLNKRCEPIPRVQTNLNLPLATRKKLERAIDHRTIHSLTEAMVFAVDLLDAKLSRNRKGESAI
jgi:hypothetical protein